MEKYGIFDKCLIMSFYKSESFLFIIRLNKTKFSLGNSRLIGQFTNDNLNLFLFGCAHGSAPQSKGDWASTPVAKLKDCVAGLELPGFTGLERGPFTVSLFAASVPGARDGVDKQPLKLWLECRRRTKNLAIRRRRDSRTTQLPVAA